MGRRRMGALLFGALVAGGLTTGGTAHAEDEPVTAAPAPVYDELTNGSEAVDQLGDDLPEVAESVGMSPAELEGELLEDPELHVDLTGQPVYVDRGLLEVAPPEGAYVPAPAAPFAYADTFALHSKPGAAKVVYLDFDGFTVTGTAWNTSYNSGSDFTASPYDSDGNPGSFSTAEQDVIQDVWVRIAEDYAPFDVDVTTEDPGAAAIARSDAADAQYGTRLVITNTDTIGSTCGCGGIAYVGVFDRAGTHAAYQPAFVFTRSNKTAKFIAEAGAHEVGHNLGLSHDGVRNGDEYYGGHADWAPIMGVGYSRSVTQWSKGEYRSASNRQDDLAVIASHGLAERVDEAGAKTADATFLGEVLPIEHVGYITNRKDVDLYRFNAGAGSLTVTVDPAAVSPDLDVELQVLDGRNRRLARVNPTDSMGATVTLDVAEGTYYVRIDGAKSGSGTSGYSDYASIGAYTVTVTGTSFTGSIANQSPKAKITTASTTIGVPGPVALSNAGSYDPDGDLATTTWDFGDGSEPATGATVQHTFTAEGYVTVTMTVTDADGAATAKTMRLKGVPAVTVNQMTSGTLTVSRYTYAAVQVKVVDAQGNPVEKARVQLKWTGTKAATGSATTGADGVAVVRGPRLTGAGSYTVNVYRVTASGRAYNGLLTGAVTSVTSLAQTF